MNIYHPDGSVLIKDVPITSNAKHYEELMKANYIKLSWNDSVFQTLPTGAYIEYDHVKYKLFEDYTPTVKDEVKCTYEPEFQHPMMLLDHTPCLYSTYNVAGEAVKEPTWTYTGTLQLIVGRINTIIQEELGVLLDTSIIISDKTLSPSATVSFDGDTIWSALGKICQAWDNKIEFHVLWDITRGTSESVNGCLYVGDIAINEDYKGGIATLTEGENVVTTSRTENNKNEYANYFIVRGGTRNITTNITASQDHVQTDTRMTLDAAKYPGSIIDKRSTQYQPKIQDILIFDDIYPSLTLYCANIRERVRRRQNEDGDYIVKEYNADGTVKSYKTYSVYYMRLYYPVKDSSGNVTSWKEFSFDPTKDMVSGKTLMCSFVANEEGKHSSLAGRDFELRYHTADRTIPASEKTGDSGVSIRKGDWEIVFEESDDMIIPNSDTLAPYGESSPSLQCDTLLLYNILLTGDYLTNARNKLEAAALEEIANRMTDYDNYTLKSYPHVFKKNNPKLFIGQKVTYTIRGNVMDSHVIKLETDLDCEHKQIITLGNAKITGTITSVKDDVKAMSGVIDVNTSSIKSITTTLANIMRQIREWANNFLSRVEDDTAEGHITFNAGLTANQTAKLNEGATFGDLFSFDKNGNIVAHTLTSSDYDKLAITDDHEDKKGYTIAVKDSTDGTYKLLIDELRAWSRTVTDELVAKGTVSNGDFISGFLGGKGWGITSREVVNSAGVAEEKWTAEFDNLVVRGGMKVYEMVVSQLVGENDNRVFTGMLEVDHYDPTTGKVYLDTNDGQTYNPFRTGDYIMVQRFTYATSETADVTKGYELIVEDYGSEGEGEDMLAWVTFNNFTSSFVEDATPETMIAEGDTFVRVDNVQDPDRKGIVQIISVGTATPYMDVIHGLKTDPDNALKARLGNLQGIVHPVFGKLLGFGLYSSNAYLTGDFVIARTGENIDTKFQILEDRFSSQIAKTEDGLTDENNFLHNGRFCLNDNCDIDGWTQSGDDAVFYLDPDGNPLFINGQTTMDGQNRAVLDMVGGKKVLHLYTDGDPSTPAVAMTQVNALIKQPTKHKEYSVEGDDADTAKDKETEVFDTMYLSCKLLPKAGTKVSVLLGVNNGYTLAISKTYDKDCTVWQTEEVAGVWDGKGDFVLTVDGDCYVTDVMLTTDPVASLAASYSTNITQTAKKIELQAKKVTAQGESISALEQTASGISSTVSSLKSNVYTNLFGFCKDIAFEGGGTILPYIQAYGVYYTGSTHYRVKNLGFNGTGGDFVVRCRVYSSAAVTINFDICDKASNEGKVDVSAYTWTTVVRTFSNVTNYVDASGYNGFFDAEVSNSGAQITIADLSIERGTVASSVCTLCKEDAAAFGKGYRIQEWIGDASATTETVNGESTTVYKGAVPSSGFVNFLFKNYNNSAGNSKVYTLSFWARADVSGMKILSYLYGNDNCPSGGQEYTESLTGGGSQSVRNVADGSTETTLTTTWKKYYVHWKTVNDKTFHVIPFRADSSVNPSYVGKMIYVANVVIEEGYICEENAASAYSYSKIEQTANSISLKVKTAEDTANTAQTTANNAAGKADTAQTTANTISQGLKDTGIDIESKKVIVTANNFTVNNNSGDKVFCSDSDGNLSITGTVTAASGKIGAFSIKDTGLYASGFADTKKQHATTFDVTSEGLSMVFDSDEAHASTQSYLKYGCSSYGTLLQWDDAENNIHFNLGRWGQEDTYGLEYTRKYTDNAIGGTCTVTTYMGDHIMVSRVPQASSYASYGNWCEISSSASNQSAGFTGISAGQYSSGTKSATVQLGTVRAKYGNGNFDTYAKLKMRNLPYIPNTSNSTYLAIYNSLETGQVYIGENNVLKIKG